MHRLVQTIQKIARQEAAQQLGPLLGIVTSTFHDSDYSCTVKLRESGLVLPKVPIATGLIGTVAPPRENDLVIVVFLGDNIHAPVVIGRLYNETVSPPAHQPGEYVTILPGGEESPDKSLQCTIATPGDGTRSLSLTLDGSIKIEVEVNDEGVRIQAQDATLKLSQTSSSDGKAELSVAGSKVTIEQSGNITVTAEGTLKLQASQIEIAADTTVKVAGQMVNLN